MICNIAQNITGSVSGQVLTIAQPVIAADSVDYLTARFSFSEDWTGADKFAFFAKAGHEDEPAEILLIDDEITADAHLNLPAGRWKVWLVGLRTEGAEITQRITTTVAELRVQLSGVTDGEPFPGETGSAGEQVVAQAIAARNAAQTAAGTATACASAAAGSAAAAEQSANAAAGSATTAGQSATAAQNAQTAAEAASTAAAGSVAAAEQSANAAAGSATTAGQSETAAQNAQTAAETARTAAQTAERNASASATNAEASAKNAEAWAVGKRDGVDVPSTDPSYENNSKYYSERAKLYAEAAKGTVKTASDIKRVCRLGLANLIFRLNDRIIVPRETSLTAGIGDSAGITGASVNAEKWITVPGIEAAGIYEFTYDGAVWHFDDVTISLADYGITIAGTPAEGDKVIVTVTADSMEMRVVDVDTVNGEWVMFMPVLAWLYGSTTMQFDATEALYYCEEALEPGTYCFSLPDGYDTSYNEGWTAFHFTLAQGVPAGGQIIFPWGYNTRISTTKVSTYASASSTTAIESNVAVASGESGTNLGQITSTGDPSATNINNIARARYGSNRYKESGIRQYINSSATAGNWWTPQNKWDRPHNLANSAPGFLHGMDKDWLDNLAIQTYVTCLNTITDGGTSETLTDLVVLPSRSELYGGEERSAYPEGAALAYFRDYSDLSSPGRGTDSNRIFRKSTDGTTAYYVWMRTPQSVFASNARYMHYAGNIYDNTSYSGYGVSPRFKISASGT